MTARMQIIIAAFFHIVFICMAFLLMQYYSRVLLNTFVLAAIAFWIFRLITNRRGCAVHHQYSG